MNMIFCSFSAFLLCFLLERCGGDYLDESTCLKSTPSQRIRHWNSTRPSDVYFDRMLYLTASSNPKAMTEGVAAGSPVSFILSQQKKPSTAGGNEKQVYTSSVTYIFSNALAFIVIWLSVLSKLMK